LITILNGCNTHKKIKLVGLAANAKAGGIIYVDSSTVNNMSTIVYFKDMYSWKPKYLNQKIIVKGYLDTVVNNYDSGYQNINVKLQIDHYKIKLKWWWFPIRGADKIKIN
jgi:hypothetical protein